MIAVFVAAVLLLLPLAGQGLSAGNPAQVLHIGSRRELFVDRYLIDRMQNTELRLQTPVDKGVAFQLDKPWEGRFSIYTTVLRDTDRYRIYYRGMPGVPPEAPDVRFTCYAESRDGIHWTKPDLGMFEVYGTRHNNVIVANDAQTSGIFTPFIDTRPGIPASERYKATGGSIDPGLYLLSSPDGIHWSKMNVPLIRPPQKGPGLDSQDVVFWSETEQMYVCYFRTVKSFSPSERPSQTGGEPWAVRWVSRTTSKDLKEWTPPVEMSFGDAPPEHFYTNQTSPYFRAPHIYLGLAARFWPGRQALSDAQANTIHAHPRYYKDISDAALLTTRGGDRYERTFLESFLRPGIGPENWVSRTNYPALNIVQTGPSEISFYVNRNYSLPTAHLERYALRLDGFSSIHAPYSGGEMVTQPLRFRGRMLEINYSTSAAGSIRVEIQGMDGQPIPGFHLADCPEIIGDEIARVVSWKGGSDVSRLAGNPVRLRFVMKDADLFSLRFRR